MVDVNEEAVEPQDEGTEDLVTGCPEAVRLQEDVKESIKGEQEGGAIRLRVVNALVEEEVQVRADLLTKALVKRKAQAQLLAKMRPDQCGFNEDGSSAFAHWTKPRLKEKTDAQKKLNKIDRAINMAIQKADYEGIKKFASE